MPFIFHLALPAHNSRFFPIIKGIPSSKKHQFTSENFAAVNCSLFARCLRIDGDIYFLSTGWFDTVNQVFVEIGFGELFDKISILGIKRETISGQRNLKNVENELSMQLEIRTRTFQDTLILLDLVQSLRTANESIWEFEDEIRPVRRPAILVQDLLSWRVESTRTTITVP